MTTVTAVLGAPELIVLKYILLTFVGVYLFALIASWLLVFVRGQLQRQEPSIESIVHWSLFFAFLIQLVLPIYTLVQMLATGEFRSFWYLVPYAIISGVILLLMFWVYSKTRLRPHGFEEEGQ